MRSIIIVSNANVNVYRIPVIVTMLVLSFSALKTEAITFVNTKPVCKIEAKIIKIKNTELTFDFIIKIFGSESVSSLIERKTDSTPATEKDYCVQTFPATTTIHIKGNKYDFYTDSLYEPHVGQIILAYAQKIKLETTGEEQTMFLDFRNDKYGIELLKDYGNLPSDNPIISIVNFIKGFLARFNIYL